jgi:hypothetical protein
MSIKVRFHFAFEAALLNSQTTVLHIKSMQVENDDDIYLFPPHRQLAEFHDELLKLPSAKSARKALTTRGQFRRPYVNLPAEVAAIYLDTALMETQSLMVLCWNCGNQIRVRHPFFHRLQFKILQLQKVFCLS